MSDPARAKGLVNMIIGLIPFPRLLVLCEMLSVSSRIWTRVALSISYDDNHYTTGTLTLIIILFNINNLFSDSKVVLYTIHIQLQNTQYIYRRTLLYRYERFINFLTSVHRNEERDTIPTMLTIFSDPTNAQRILWCLRSPSVEIRKTQLHLQLSTVCQKLNYLPACSNLNF